MKITAQFTDGAGTSSPTESFAFAENPMVIEVSDYSFPQGSSFRQIVVEVEATMSGANSQKHSFSIPIDNSQDKVAIDIASSARSVTRQYKYNPPKIKDGEYVEYNFATIKVTSYIQYMADDGSIMKKQGVSVSNIYVYFGGLSEHERWCNPDVYPNPYNSALDFDTKPKTNEAYIPVFSTESSFSSRGEGLNYVVQTTFMKSTTPSSGVRTILFVNSRGVYETVGVRTRESKEYELSSETHRGSSTPSYKPNTEFSVQKVLGPATWHMSSGYVDRIWAEWFVTEFLVARHYWLLDEDGKCLPVVISPAEDAITVYDRNDPTLRDIQFTMRASINGAVDW